MKIQCPHCQKSYDIPDERFKGLGEISPDEFEAFIAENIRLEPVYLKEHTDISAVLGYYMGKNTPERQEFIIDNLKVELSELERAKEIKDGPDIEKNSEVLQEA